MTGSASRSQLCYRTIVIGPIFRPQFEIACFRTRFFGRRTANFDATKKQIYENDRLVEPVAMNPFPRSQDQYCGRKLRSRVFAHCYNKRCVPYLQTLLINITNPTEICGIYVAKLADIIFHIIQLYFININIILECL